MRVFWILRNTGRLIVAAGVLQNIAIERNLKEFDGEEDDFIEYQVVREIVN